MFCHTRAKNVFLTHVNRTERAQNRNRSDFARRRDVRQTDVSLPDQLSPVLTGSVSVFACGTAGGGFDGDGTVGMRPDGPARRTSNPDVCGQDRALIRHLAELY